MTTLSSAAIANALSSLHVCPTCDSDFDVVADPPPDHFKLTATFVATACYDGCGEELGPMTYEAFDLRAEGLLGN